MHQKLQLPCKVKKSYQNPDLQKSDVLVAKSYCPTSVTTLFSKIPGRILYRQTTTFVGNHGNFTLIQFGFRSAVSSPSAILHFVGTLCQVIENCNLVHAVRSDLSKAFDPLSHEILLKKLKSQIFSQSAIKNIERFLTQRFQQVTLIGIISELIEVK